jgi:hypothetical protein
MTLRRRQRRKVLTHFRSQARTHTPWRSGWRPSRRCRGKRLSRSCPVHQLRSTGLISTNSAGSPTRSVPWPARCTRRSTRLSDRGRLTKRIPLPQRRSRCQATASQPSPPRLADQRPNASALSLGAARQVSAFDHAGHPFGSDHRRRPFADECAVAREYPRLAGD